MRRTVVLLALLVCLFAVANASAQKDKPKSYTDILGAGLKVGTRGHFYANGSPSKPYRTKVGEIIDKDTMVMYLDSGTTFIVKGIPTKNLADDEVHHLEGEWKVTGTEKHAGKTYKVVEPVKKE